MRTYYVYMMASHTKVLYIGVTNNLETRVSQHKGASPTTFTGKYNVDRLVWYEDYPQISDAIAREKQLKGWRRSKKVALIGAVTRPGSTSAIAGSIRWRKANQPAILRLRSG